MTTTKERQRPEEKHLKDAIPMHCKTGFVVLILPAEALRAAWASDPRVARYFLLTLGSRLTYSSYLEHKTCHIQRRRVSVSSAPDGLHAASPVRGRARATPLPPSRAARRGPRAHPGA